MIDTKNLDIAIEAAIEAGEAIMDIYNSSSFEIEYKADSSPLTLADRTAHQIICSRLADSNFPILSEESNQIAFEERKQWDIFWLVDPLDGTKEFIQGNGEFTVNIALIEQHKPVAGIIYIPVTRELYVSHITIGAYKIIQPEKNSSFSTLINSAQNLPFEKHDFTYRIIASRLHQNADTKQFIQMMQKIHPQTEIIYAGSSLKFCKIAENHADIYPRFAPTMEWDTAAAHALLKACGKNLVSVYEQQELTYNKQDLHNPYFIAE